MLREQCDGVETIQPAYMRVGSLARYTGLSISFFNNARVQGGGPPFHKIGGAVLYKISEVDRWFNSRRIISTSAADSTGCVS